MMLGINDFGTLQHIYGKELADTFINNARLTVFMSARDQAGTEFLSRKLGEMEVFTEGLSITTPTGRGGPSFNRNHGKIRRRVLEPFEIAQMNPENLIAFMDGVTRPILIAKRPYYKTELNKIARPNPMPRRTVEQLDERDIRIQDLQDEVIEFRNKAEALAEQLLALKGVMQARMFLMIAAFTVPARAVLGIWQREDDAFWIDQRLHAVVTVLVVMWGIHAIKEMHWKCVPYLVVIVEAMYLNYLNLIHPQGIYAVLGALLFGCTRTCEVVFPKMLVFLEGIYDTRRKDRKSFDSSKA